MVQNMLINHYKLQQMKRQETMTGNNGNIEKEIGTTVGIKHITLVEEELKKLACKRQSFNKVIEQKLFHIFTSERK